MSNVRKNERKEHSLVLLDKALDLYDRMTTAIANEKTFDRAYANLINRIDQEATTIYHYLRSANEDYDSRIKEDAEMRIALEEKAIKQCMWLKTDIRLAKKKFHLRASRIIFWDGLINDLIAAIKSWKKSEETRYKETHGL